ncbi:hypothetical protein SO802_012599 [Lithocarpus litseifolius]|uniref:Uncharacterized protein n=1 Tax=Lithocarpus litseifolius TaxID=425828 RepID=A0AAW2D5R2_9ROSI
MTRYGREESTPIVQHTGLSSSTHLGGDSLTQISTNVEAQLVGTPSTTEASTSRHSRGMTHGLGVRGLVERHRKLPVCIAPEFCAFVGEHAAKFASQIGVQVHTKLSTMNAYSWKNVGSGEKEAIIQNVANQFDIQGESVPVNKSLNTKCGRLLSSHYNRLFAKYKKLVKDEGSTKSPKEMLETKIKREQLTNTFTDVETSRL